MEALPFFSFFRVPAITKNVLEPPTDGSFSFSEHQLLRNSWWSACVTANHHVERPWGPSPDPRLESAIPCGAYVVCPSEENGWRPHYPQFVWVANVNEQPSCDQSKKFTIQWAGRFLPSIDSMVARLFFFGNQVPARGVGSRRCGNSV